MAARREAVLCWIPRGEAIALLRHLHEAGGYGERQLRLGRAASVRAALAVPGALTAISAR
jgi:hypothetical protein